MKRSFKVAAATVLLAGSAVYARAAYIPLPVKVEKSDLIARVEVLSTTQVVPLMENSETGQLKPRILKPGEYRNRADVKVVQSIKGLKAGEVYTLEFDNGVRGSNVWYQKGEECLVFNTKMKNGHYETFNTQYGKHTVKEGKVAGWKLNSDQATPLGEVVEEITKLMQAPKEAE